MADPPVEVFLAVGSNIDPERNILEALQRIQRHARVTGVSTLYRTEPLDRPDQPPFLNGVWRVATPTPARTFKFDGLRRIEQELGRVRTADKHAPRTIDLDIILYGHAVIDEPDLRIPDPELRRYPFIFVPLLELAPDLVLPDTGERLATIVPPKMGALEPAEEFTERLRLTALQNQ